MTTSLQELFNVSDQLAKNLEITHKLAVPKISKIIINAGIGTIKEDNKAIEKMKKDLSLITGQAPVVRLSKKAIASFKIRKGMPVGLSVTLRKTIMKEFYDRLVNIAMPVSLSRPYLTPDSSFSPRASFSICALSSALICARMSGNRSWSRKSMSSNVAH